MPNFDSKMFSKTIIPALHLKTADVIKAGNESVNYIDSKLNEHLKQEIIKVFGGSSEQLKASIRELNLNYRDFQESDLNSVLNNRVLPLLKENTALKEELENRNTYPFSSFNKKIGEMLHLDINLADNPLLTEEVRKSKTYELALIAGVRTEKAQKLADRDIYLETASESTWNALIKNKTITKGQKRKLQLALSLSHLTGSNFKLIRALRVDKLSSVEELAALDKSGWVDIIKKSRIQTPNKETIDEYADNIVYNIEKTYPTEFFLHRTVFKDKRELSEKPIEQEKIQSFANRYKHLGIPAILKRGDNTEKEKHTAIKSRIETFERFFSNNPDIDIKGTNFFKSSPDSGSFNWEGIDTSDRMPIRKQCMAYQRVLKLSGRQEESSTLLDNGFDSAKSITALSREQFREKTGLSAAVSDNLYSSAQDIMINVNHSVEAVRDAIKGNFNDTVVGNVDESLINDLKEIDGYEDLFGIQNYCDCDHCRSIFSPAAYFVDLMYFINKNISYPNYVGGSQNQVDSHNPLQLRNRRPDLWKLQLTCENTNTLVPYLEIVNEVLEEYLKLVTETEDVYELLSREDVSFRLPFNLPLSELRLILNQSNLKLSEIYKVLGQPQEAYGRERLNLSVAEMDLITRDRSATIGRYFGNPSDLSEMRVENFLKYTGITREELDDLTELEYVNSGSHIQLLTVYDTNDIQQFYEKITSLDKNKLDRIHRFIRLWHCLPWSMHELDLIISALKGASLCTPIDAETIKYIAAVLDIQESLKISVEEICGLFYRIPEYPVKTTGSNGSVQPKSSLFERLFKKPEEFFSTASNKLLYYHGYFDTSANSDIGADPNTPVLLAGLSLKEVELIQLLKFLKDENLIGFYVDTRGVRHEGTFEIDRDKLSLLYRYAKIANVYKITVDECIKASVLRLSPETNLNNKGAYIRSMQNIQHTAGFIGWVKQSPFSISDLWFGFGGEKENNLKYKITPDKTVDIITKVQTEMQQYSDPAMLITKSLLPSISAELSISDDQIRLYTAFIQTQLNSQALRNALNAKIGNDGAPLNPNDIIPLADAIKNIEQLKLLFDKLELKQSSIRFVADNSNVFKQNSINFISVNHLLDIVYYKYLLGLKEDHDDTVHSLILSYKNNLSFSADDISHIAEIFSCSSLQVQSVKNNLPLSRMPMEDIRRIEKCLSATVKIGVSGDTLKLLTETGYESLALARNAIYGAFKAKYSNDNDWTKAIEPVEDKINEMKRNALCSYIISLQNVLKFKDRNELYAHFLIDIEMEGCARTSRVVSAISSLQLYIHRCLVNLEQSETTDYKVTVSEDAVKEWEWRKNYRVWEANRRVFLYPENYIEPELRDDKTPIFKDLEDEMLQQKITREAAENAYKSYLSQFTKLAKLKIAGCYYQEDPGSEYWYYMNSTFYLFGKTNADQPQYYYRKYSAYSGVWSPWIKIELGINSPYVSALVRMGRLHLFWVEININEKSRISNGNSIPYYEYKADLLYSYMNESGKWEVPQRKTITSKELPNNSQLAYQIRNERNFGKCYVYLSNNTIEVSFCQDTVNEVRYIFDILDLYNNKLIQKVNVDSGHVSVINEVNNFGAFTAGNIYLYTRGNEARLVKSIDGCYRLVPEVIFDEETIITDNTDNLEFLTGTFQASTYNPEINTVNSKMDNVIVKLGEQQFLIHKVDVTINSTEKKCKFEKLTTSLPDKLGERLFYEGIDSLLSIKTQKGFKEDQLNLSYDTSFVIPPSESRDHINFKGAYGQYYRELFFHIPFLIANHLNAIQSFEDAKYWYEKIFNPMASENPPPGNPVDVNWQYVDFRGLTLQKLKDILTDNEAIEKYKEDPFNPHAIARLRISAYQKAIVMKYIDNLLDWADSLFARDTTEAINEASMLYILASDILGKKPVKMDKCKTACDEQLTYENIGPAIERGSEFLINIENWYHLVYFSNTGTNAVSGNTNALNSTGTSGTSGHKRKIMSYAEAAEQKAGSVFDRPLYDYEDLGTPQYVDIYENVQVFCIPANDKLLSYWDRVEKQLYKIRNCLDINGNRRQLALFQPPIDPAMLVKAKASGLNLEDVLAAMNAELSPYRFTYLVEKAKQYAGTVQSFGTALLNALEKRDAEDLLIMKTIHEQNILKLTRLIKKKQIEDAAANLASLEESEKNIINTINYYDRLINAGLIPWEKVQQTSRHVATTLRTVGSLFFGASSILYLIPQLGSPFAIKYGGKELGDSGDSWGQLMDTLASISESLSESAGLEATFQRRDEEWKHELVLSRQELVQISKQKLAAQIKIDIATQDLEMHDVDMEQTKLVFDRYKEKFTNLELFNYMVSSLNKLYRQAYNTVYNLAQTAERAYQFETDDMTFYLQNDNWQADKAGLLAGERLILQLQAMEKAYMEQNQRAYEIPQHFSMREIDPAALVSLKETGECTFEIPEIMFDLYYPGQYKRIIKNVRITIPCVVGPYTNVSCKLTLMEYKIRKNPDSQALLPVSSSSSVAISSAVNDAGVFELNLRDERYMPFEGAGAISTWRLELPTVFKPFDYDTISDVVFHINYTAKAGDLQFKTSIQNNLKASLNSLTQAGECLYRLFSLKHEFVNDWFKFISAEDSTAEINISSDSFMFMFRNKTIKVERMELILVVKDEIQANNTEYANVLSQTLQRVKPDNTSEAIVLSNSTGLGNLPSGEIPGVAGIQITNSAPFRLKVKANKKIVSSVKDIGIMCYFSIV